MTDSLITLFSDILDIDASKITDETSPLNTPQWDSLTSMLLVAALEETYNVHLSTSEIEQLINVREVRNTLSDKGVDV